MAKSFDCDKCVRVFDKCSNFKRHVQRFHSDRPKAKIGRPKQHASKSKTSKRTFTKKPAACPTLPNIVLEHEEALDLTLSSKADGRALVKVDSDTTPAGKSISMADDVHEKPTGQDELTEVP